MTNPYGQPTVDQPAHPGGWFSEERPPPPLRPGASWADAAASGLGVPPPPTTSLPNASPWPAAPDAPAGARPPHEGGRTRVLVAVTVAVLLLAGAATVLSLQPWKGSSTKASSAGPAAATGSATTPAPQHDTTPPPNAPLQSAPPTASDSASTSASPSGDEQSQAQQLDVLLGQSSSSRTSVQTAVNSVSSCTDLANARDTLNAAADARRQEINDLNALALDGVPDFSAPVAQLRAAWQASMAADGDFAGWADANLTNGCPAGQDSYNSAVVASSHATTAKQQFIALWNPIAARYGLPSRTDGEI